MIFTYSGDATFIVTNTTIAAGTLQFVSTAAIGDQFSITLETGGNQYVFASVNGNCRLYPPGNVNINPAIGNYEQPAWTNINNRVVKVKCTNWAALRLFQIPGIYFSVPQKLNVPFARMARLTSFQITDGTPYNRITEFDTGLVKLPFFTNLNVQGSVFTTDSRFYGVIPDDVLAPTLNVLTWTGVGTANTVTLKNKPFTETNFTSINPTKLPNLTQLGIEYSYMGGYDDSDAGEGAYPDIWNTFPNLQVFSYNLSFVTGMPPKMANLPTTLLGINFLYNNNATSYANLGNLVNLTGINLTGSPRIPGTLPSFFSNLTKLKNLVYIGVGRDINPDTNWMTNFFTSLYNLVTTNAPITGNSSSPFRNMVISTRSVNGDSVGMQLVIGVEQAPAGYVQGVSNGTPANDAERIYVLKNQYAHNIAYPS